MPKNPKITESICPICKKEYIPAPEHSYKIPTKKTFRKVCSYHCMRDYERRNGG